MSTEIRRIGGLMAVNEFLRSTDGLDAWPLLAESEYVDRMLAFANATPAKDSAELQELGFELVTGNRLNDDERGDAESWQEDEGEFGAAQRQLIQWLETVRTGTKAEFEKFVSLVCEACSRMVVRPGFNAKAGRLDVEFRFYPDDLEAAFGYALHLLLREPRGRNRLCRCRYLECHRFFLEVKPPTGRPRRDYCSQEHFDAARKLGAAIRIREYRKEQRVKQGRKARRAGK